jgi:hypothetical protein
MVRVDTSKSYQTIAGFGVSVPATAEAVYGPHFYDALLNDLGCSIVCSESESEIVAAMKAMKANLGITSQDDPANVLSNIDKRGTWGYLMEVRVSNPQAKLSDIYDRVYSGIGVDKRLIELGSDDPIWKAVYEDKSEVTSRNPAFFTKIPSAGMDLVRRINSALIHGFSGYVCGPATTQAETDDPAKALCKMGELDQKFQAAKHFFKYVTPGMVRVAATSDDLVVSAFKSDQTVLVLINDKDDIIDTHIEFGDSASQCTSYTSVENDFHYKESWSLKGGKLDLTAIPNSITTFIVDN